MMETIWIKMASMAEIPFAYQKAVEEYICVHGDVYDVEIKLESIRFQAGSYDGIDATAFFTFKEVK